MTAGLRRKNPKPKDARELPLPGNLVAFLAEVSRAVEAGREETTIPSDDLIQTDFAYGGLDEADGEAFSFTFSPEDGVRQQWELWLTKSELRDVRDGRLTALTMWCCRTPGCRCAFRNPDDTCFDCDWDPPADNDGE